MVDCHPQGVRPVMNLPTDYINQSMLLPSEHIEKASLSSSSSSSLTLFYYFHFRSFLTFNVIFTV